MRFAAAGVSTRACQRATRRSRADIELAKRLGFNGARKHQKIEDPRYLYWADRLGFLVWEEMPSAYRYSPRYVRDLTCEWAQVIARDRNHPCIIVWVPMNESWGVPAVARDPDARQHYHLLGLYHVTRALDATRLVVSNDGWEHAVTDLCTIHDYGAAAALRERLADRDRAVESRPLHHPIYIEGHSHRGEPIIVSEFAASPSTAPARGASTPWRTGTGCWSGTASSWPRSSTAR